MEGKCRARRARLILFGALVVFAGGATPPVTAANNNYLEALKAEAASDEPETEIPQTYSDEQGRPSLRTDDQEQMEQWLKDNYVGSYMFYQRLSDAKKKAVHRLYRSGADISQIRDTINDLLRQ